MFSIGLCFVFNQKKANTTKKWRFLAHHRIIRNPSRHLVVYLAPWPLQMQSDWSPELTTTQPDPESPLFWDRVIWNRVKSIWGKDRIYIYTHIYHIYIYILCFFEKRGWWSQKWLNDYSWWVFVGLPAWKIFARQIIGSFPPNWGVLFGTPPTKLSQQKSSTKRVTKQQTSSLNHTTLANVCQCFIYRYNIQIHGRIHESFKKTVAVGLHVIKLCCNFFESEKPRATW